MESIYTFTMHSLEDAAVENAGTDTPAARAGGSVSGGQKRRRDDSALDEGQGRELEEQTEKKRIELERVERELEERKAREEQERKERAGKLEQERARQEKERAESHMRSQCPTKWRTVDDDYMK